jgi:hypothetical protein
MRAKARQQLEAQLLRLEHQRDDTKRKLRALVQQAQRKRRYQYGELVELAGLAQVDPGTLLGGLCALTTMLADGDTVSRWKGAGDALLADHRRRKGHRKRTARPSRDGTLPPAAPPIDQEEDT